MSGRVRSTTSLRRDGTRYHPGQFPFPSLSFRGESRRAETTLQMDALRTPTLFFFFRSYAVPLHPSLTRNFVELVTGTTCPESFLLGFLTHFRVGFTPNSSMDPLPTVRVAYTVRGVRTNLHRVVSLPTTLHPLTLRREHKILPFLLVLSRRVFSGEGLLRRDSSREKETLLNVETSRSTP